MEVIFLFAAEFLVNRPENPGGSWKYIFGGFSRPPPPPPPGPLSMEAARGREAKY